MADEDPQDRLHRELIELLNELRVALPGIQVLFAFLLTVPFTQRFDRLSDRTVDIYFAAVVLAAVSSILLIAPAAQHRTRFRKGSKEQLLKIANAMALSGTFVLAFAMGATVYVIADLVYGAGPARIVGPAVAIGATLLWFVLPLFLRNERERANPSRH